MGDQYESAHLPIANSRNRSTSSVGQPVLFFNSLHASVIFLKHILTSLFASIASNNCLSVKVILIRGTIEQRIFSLRFFCNLIKKVSESKLVTNKRYRFQSMIKIINQKVISLKLKPN